MTSGINYFVEAVRGMCTHVATEAGPYLPRFLDALDAEIARWRTTIAGGAEPHHGQTDTPARVAE